MKIVHVYSQNLAIFEEALKDTGCCLNGSKDIKYLTKSLSNFNVRDVLGLIIFQQHLTRRTLNLIKTFDEYFVFSPRPIILICDEAHELYKAKKIRVRNSELFLIDSLDGTISDVDINRVFTTLICVAGEMYDLKSVEQLHGLGNATKTDAIISVSPDREMLSASHLKTLKSVESIMQELKELGV